MSNANAIRAALEIGESAARTQHVPPRRTAADFKCALLALAEMEAEIADLRVSVVAFGGPVMVQQAKDHGLPPGHLFSDHYDILARAGARMVDFTRGKS